MFGAQGLGCRVFGFRVRCRRRGHHICYSLNSLKGVSMGDYLGRYDRGY